MEEKKEERKVKTNSTGKTIIIVILVILIIGLVLYICYDKGLIFSSNKNTTSSNIKEELAENVEKEITDNLLINDLSQKITYLNTQSVYVGYESFIDDYNLSNTINRYFFRSNIYETTLTDDEKLDITLNSLLSSYENLSIAYENMDSASQSIFKPYAETGSVSDIAEKQISQAKVEERYELLFGEKLSNNKNVGKCPMYVYDNVNKVYYYTRVCGGTDERMIYIYKNKFTTKNDEAYVYVNLGNSFDKTSIYDGYGKEKLIDSYTENYSINKSNYSKFTEYKYTFKRNSDGNYYFSKLEKNN